MPTPSEPVWSPEPGEILTVAELLGRVRGALEAQFGWVWVEGEVSNLRVPASGHAYFTLRDPQAQLRAVCFRQVRRLLPVALADGSQVLARGRVTLYETRGDVQLVVDDLEPVGEGLLRLEVETRKRLLAAEGLFDPARKRALPHLPRAIGVVTSATGAALQDILQVLGRRAPGVDVVVSPSRVQGEGAARELCAALERLATCPGVEVVILGRGGGAAEDLGAFNEEALVRAVAACPVPVISAVGHETDLTLCDLAADLRAPTPSAAAELAAGEWRAWGERLERARAGLAVAYRSRVAGLSADRERWNPLLRSPRRRVQRQAIVVDRAWEALAAAMDGHLHRQGARLARLETRLARHDPRQRLRERVAHLQHLTGRLSGAARHSVACRQRLVERWRGELGALSPLAVLERGYAVVRTATGAVVRCADHVNLGSSVSVRLARGALECTVDAVHPVRAGDPQE